MIFATYKHFRAIYLSLFLILLVSTSFARSGRSYTRPINLDHSQPAQNTPRETLRPIEEVIEQLEAYKRADRVRAIHEILERRDETTVAALEALVAQDNPSDPRNGGRAHSIRKAKELLSQMTKAINCTQLTVSLEEGIRKFAAKSPAVEAMDLIQQVTVGNSENYRALTAALLPVEKLRQQIEAHDKKSRIKWANEAAEPVDTTLPDAPLAPLPEESDQDLSDVCKPVPVSLDDEYFELREQEEAAWLALGDAYYAALRSDVAKKAGITIQKRRKATPLSLASTSTLDTYELTIRGTQYIARVQSGELILHLRPGSKPNFRAPLSEVMAPLWSGTGKNKKLLRPSEPKQTIELNLGVQASHFTGDYKTILDRADNKGKDFPDDSASNWHDSFLRGIPDLIYELNCKSNAPSIQDEVNDFYKRINKARELSPLDPQIRKQRDLEHPFPGLKQDNGVAMCT